MELRTRTPLLRRAATMVALVALAAPATAGAAPNVKAEKDTSPVVASVRPMDVAVGDVLRLRGKHFRAGVGKTTVVFKRDGARAVAAKADRSTTTLLWITVPAALRDQMRVRGGKPLSTRFRLRVLGTSFGRRYTSLNASPTIVPCEDGDLLGYDLEAAIKTDPCKADTDGDGVSDGFEYQSAKDLNDDEDQDANEFLPYPGKRPYPNALDPKDVDKDFDGDSLTLAEEHALWRYTWQTSKTDAHTLTPLSYSDGEQYSRSRRVESGSHAGRRMPWLKPGERDGQFGRPADQLPPTFAEWAATKGYRTVMLSHQSPWDPWFIHDDRRPFGLFDFDRDGYETDVERGAVGGYMPDDKRDADSDGLSNYDETHGFMLESHWTACYPKEKPFWISYAVKDTDNDRDGVRDAATDPDTDGDGIRDGADDEDHDDVPNVMELSRIAASHLNDTDGRDCSPRKEPPLEDDPGRSYVYGQVNPFNPCMPHRRSRTCPRYWSAETGAPFDGSPVWHSLN